MKIDLFDRYDIRTRICAFIFVVSPFLLDAYILVEASRSLATTAIVAVVLIAGSGLATCWMRYMGNTVAQVDYIAQYLLPSSTAVDANTLDRYYTKLIGLEPGFVDLKSNDLNACQNAAKAVSNWLREKTRDAKFSLVHEENLNYGFIRNLYTVKSAFLVCFTAYNVLLIGFLIVSNWALSPVDYFSTIPVDHVACMIIHVTVYLVWLLGISKKILDFAAKKYAKSVIHAIDEITG